MIKILLGTSAIMLFAIPAVSAAGPRQSTDTSAALAAERMSQSFNFVESAPSAWVMAPSNPRRYCGGPKSNY